MKFKVSTSGSFYIGQYMEKLKKLGFTFSPVTLSLYCRIGGSIEIDIATLEELIAFQKEWGAIIIEDGKIEIYDDYRE